VPLLTAAASISGRAIASLFSPLANRITGTPLALAQRWISATYPSPIFPNAAEEGIS
jgi:hypothetical protein